jgi:DNA-directed RNA polymerase
MNQLELERRVIGDSIEKRLEEMREREAKGRAGDGPYSNRVYREFVMPVADAIKALIIKPGRGAKYTNVLAPIGAEVVAYTAVRVALTDLMQMGVWDNRRLAYSIGKMVYSEAALGGLHDSNPELLWMLTRDMDRRGSVQETARCATLLRAASNAGVVVTKWSKLTIEGVGNTLYWLLLQSGLLVEGAGIYRGNRMAYREVMLSEAVLSAIGGIKGFVAESTPLTCPTIEPPMPWTSLNEGGFHGAMRRAVPFAVSTTPAARPLVREADMPTFYRALNAVQASRFRVNKRVLEVAQKFVEDERPVGEYQGNVIGEKPFREAWMDAERETWTPQQLDHFTEWKAQTRDWYTRRKLNRESTGRIYTALLQAREFADYTAIHFVHFADTRGRFYAVSAGITTQGTDLQKALLEFADGKSIAGYPEGRHWFLRHGANCYGVDKVSRSDQLLWVKDHHDAILGCAEHPLDAEFWRAADSPFRFLAWCFEYAEFYKDNGYPLRVPIGMDGTCNGLQHFSALLRDPIGARATNLLPSDRPQDIYSEVAAATLRRVQLAPEDEHGYRKGWLGLGIERKVMKRPVMTTPYGVTRRTATAYVAEDYLGTKDGVPWERRRHIDAANWLMEHGWPAIADVVQSARKAMDWLSRAAVKAIKHQGGVVLCWRVPSGFLAHQSYATLDTIRIDTMVYGHRQIRVGVEGDGPDTARHKAGMAPNFVHSMDAAHLQRTVARCADEGITDFLMVHDDYGTHAADCEKMARILREEFVAMYQERDPLAEFFEDHPVAGPPPEKGALDISVVRDSPYFFN